MSLSWTDDGAPRSDVFDDIYFQPGGGLEETRAVFLRGCGLPQAWQGRTRFTVGELGFGTGLNVAALLQLWRDHHLPGQRLQIFSVEAHPLAADEARRALAVWPELDDVARRLLAAWPRRARGFHRIALPDLDAVIDLAIGEAADGLMMWQGRADAWFLDGFAPAKNPAMWSPDLMALVAARSAQGARAATFTVAGSVRRGLAAAGFTVDKRPGHGRKRERLEAVLPGAVEIPSAPARAAIIGGGIAAASLARAFAAEGLCPLIVAPNERGASGNPAALVSPAFDAGEGVNGRLHAQALARAADLYRATPGAVIAEGALRLEREPRDAQRFDKLAASRLFAPGTLVRLTADEVAARLNEPATAGGLAIVDALTVEPAAVHAAWTLGCERIVAEVRRIERHDGRWRLGDEAGRVIAEADIVCIAAGPNLRDLAGLPLSVIRGQAQWVKGPAPGPAAAWGGYAIPIRHGVLFGATHSRDDEDQAVRDADTARNLDTLAQARPRLARLLGDQAIEGRAGLRVTAKDRLPVAGALAPGLLVLGALGSRGFATAPLLGEHVAATALGTASPLPQELAAAVDPRRASSALSGACHNRLRRWADA